MTTNLAEFKEKFMTEELKIYESKYWEWILRKNHPTIGSSILYLKRECYSFSDLTIDEIIDYKEIVTIIEKTYKKLFNYDVMNYLMLMLVDKQLHFHVFPRYSKGVEFDNQLYKDTYWPKPVDLTENNVEMNTLYKLKKYLIENIKCENTLLFNIKK